MTAMVEDAVLEPPSQKWGVERLGEYCLQIGRKTALQGWYQGQALIFAKKKMKGGGKWEAWKKAHFVGYSKTTLWRYEKFAERCQSQEEFAGLSLMQALKMFAVKHRKPKLVAWKDIPDGDEPQEVAARIAMPKGQIEELNELLELAIKHCQNEQNKKEYRKTKPNLEKLLNLLS